MPTIRLVPPAAARAEGGARDAGGLGSEVLLRNVWWFIRLRWIVIALFLLTALLGLLAPGLFAAAGIAPPRRWPWILAALLAVTDLAFRRDALVLDEDVPRRRVEWNLLLQIVTDLLIATALVHIVGSTTTFVAFIYLFHIVLACIFFERGTSLLITLLSAILYLGCVGLESAGLLPQEGWLLPAAAAAQGPVMRLVYAASAVGIWVVVWHLTSRLSMNVRERDRRLEATNERLRQADEEKTRRVLQTTHELKSPFAGIESNIQVLRMKHWDELSPPVRTIIERIERRGKSLRKRIQETLDLGQLRSRSREEEPLEDLDLSQLLTGIVSDLSGHAEGRRVRVETQLAPLTVRGARRPFALMFANLLSNAISYSHEGGRVRVRAAERGGRAEVAIEDEGIGISEEALKHIFEEYYRSREAARFNRMSTGLGMAIVKEVAQRFGLEIEVDSRQDEGTTVRVSLPPGGVKAN